MSLLLRGAARRPPWLGRGGRHFIAAILATIVTHVFGHDPIIVVRELRPLTYDEVRTALQDALIDEGLARPSVSAFGEMLARTAPELGHRPDLYEHAEIFSFCSARISALLVREAPHNIAMCPLTIALYALTSRPRTVFLAYRSPSSGTPASRLADELLKRIVSRTVENAGLRP